MRIFEVKISAHMLKMLLNEMETPAYMLKTRFEQVETSARMLKMSAHELNIVPLPRPAAKTLIHPFTYNLADVRPN
jgi:hypothetical protein